MSLITTINFASDNYAGIHPAIMQAILTANQATCAPAYGSDPDTKEAVACFQKLFGTEIDVFFVFNGTGANVTALGALLTHSYHAVICADKAHIQVDECGAPEKFTGAKLLPVSAIHGKISLEAIRARLDRLGDQHHVQPKVISISQTTEYGTVYTLEEIRAIADFAHEHHLFLHMDGARISNAAVSLGVSLREMTHDAGVDVLSFGGTKNGLMCGEAVVFFDRAFAAGYPYIRKQGMQLSSKMRFMSAQFNALLSNDLWQKNACHANAMARLLADQLQSVPMITITQPVQANAVFAQFPRKIISPLQEHFYFYVWDELSAEVRLMTSFATTVAEVDAFIKAIKKLAM